MPSVATAWLRRLSTTDLSSSSSAEASDSPTSQNTPGISLPLNNNKPVLRRRGNFFMNFYHSRRRLSLPVTQMSIDNSNLDNIEKQRPNSARHASEQMGMRKKESKDETTRKNGSMPDLIEEVKNR